MKKTLLIEGMSCNHCVMHVTNALKEVEGVIEVIVSLEDKKAIVEGDNLVDEVLKEAIEDFGYELVNIK